MMKFMICHLCVNNASYFTSNVNKHISSLVFKTLNMLNGIKKTMKLNFKPMLRDVEWITGVVKVAPNLLHI